jgi:hypothetical protein
MPGFLKIIELAEEISPTVTREVKFAFKFEFLENMTKKLTPYQFRFKTHFKQNSKRRLVGWIKKSEKNARIRIIVNLKSNNVFPFEKARSGVWFLNIYL